MYTKRMTQKNKEFLAEYKKVFSLTGKPPTAREMMPVMSWKSTSSFFLATRKLADLGELEFNDGKFFPVGYRAYIRAFFIKDVLLEKVENALREGGHVKLNGEGPSCSADCLCWPVKLLVSVLKNKEVKDA